MWPFLQWQSGRIAMEWWCQLEVLGEKKMQIGSPCESNQECHEVPVTDVPSQSVEAVCQLLKVVLTVLVAEREAD